MDKNNSNRDIADWSFKPTSSAPDERVSQSSVSASNSKTSNSKISNIGGDTRIGEGSSLKGVLSFTASTHIEGSVEGEIICSDELIIAEQGLVDAKISAKYVKVFGRVSGEIYGEVLIELFAGAQVKGSISSPRIVMHDGVLFEGNCKMEAVSLFEPSAGSLLAGDSLDKVS